ncbi:MAG: tyrosine--tRNA ligase [Planctomycetaceae bacterium]
MVTATGSAACRSQNILGLCGKVTVAQLLTRDDFAKRMKAETPIYLHECLYPLMQAWDSVEIKADIELGGTEQLYSFMLARDLQKDAGLSQQIGLMSPILVGTDGKKRMGKSLGNYIGISEEPYEMMKKFMQLSDDCMRMYYELLTDLPMQEVDTILAGHPKEAKVTLAKAIISEYHDAGSADGQLPAGNVRSATAVLYRRTSPSRRSPVWISTTTAPSGCDPVEGCRTLSVQRRSPPRDSTGWCQDRRGQNQDRIARPADRSR